MNINTVPMKLMLISSNGDQTEISGDITIDEAVDNVKVIDSPNFAYLEDSKKLNCTFQNYVIKSLTIKKCSKKRAVKLLMAKGIQRNGANEIVRYLLKQHGKISEFDILMW